MTVYFDHNATTPLDGRVLAAMLPYLQGAFGNPSSPHRLGRLAREAVGRAREQVAALVGAHPSQVLFTSGGTEANNLALKGVTASFGAGRLLISAIEHASVMASARSLAGNGWQVDQLSVDHLGRLAREPYVAAIADSRLVSVMLANNETGVVQDIAPLAELARQSGALFHTDAVQAVGKMAIDFAATGAHLMSLSAHKLYGPKGIGALVRDKALSLAPLIHGGGQEFGLRGGTENVAAIVGFGAAAELACSELVARRERLLFLRNLLEARLSAQIPDVVLFAQEALRLPNTLFMAIPAIEGQTLVLELDRRGFELGSGAACGSNSDVPSHVLAAMGVEVTLARCAVRVSLGVMNTEQEIEALVAAMKEVASQLRGVAAAAWA